jgi:Zn-dependent protease
MPDIKIDRELILFFIFLPVFLISISFHEFAHALLAKKYGDNTAKDAGRMTLNPFKHIDLIGTVLIPLASFASGFALIGWAKPVPVNRKNFKDPLKNDAVVSFAGPAANFILAVILWLFLIAAVNLFSQPSDTFIQIISYGIFFNIFLGLFNLLPFPPLDGSHIMFDLFPNKFTAAVLNLGFYGSIILLIFIYSPLWRYFFSAVTYIMDIFMSAAGI